MIDELLTELGDDSEDFTDQEVEQAIVAPSVDKMIAHLRDVRCPQCGGPIEVKGGHALRRRVPHLYGRMQLICAEQHEHPIVFRLDWLQGSSSVSA